jgi:hypothetical protein
MRKNFKTPKIVLILAPSFRLLQDNQKKRLKSSLADFLRCGKLTAFWGEQQAVVAFVAAACIFFPGGGRQVSSCR